MILSLFAVLIVMIAMPASLGLVSTWNSAVSNEYVVYREFNNETSAVTGATFASLSPYKIVYTHWNKTDVAENTPQSIYDKSLFNDSMYRVILSASDTTDSATYKDRLVLSLNVTVNDLLAAGAQRLHVHFDDAKSVSVLLYYQAADLYGTRIAGPFQVNNTTGYDKVIDIDTIDFLAAENAEGKAGHFTLVILSHNETVELSPGDTIIFTWQFLKKRGNIATIYTVDNLMMLWGVALMVLAFASTPFFNPLSRDVFPFITKFRRSKAAKRAASKRKKSRRRRR